MPIVVTHITSVPVFVTYRGRMIVIIIVNNRYRNGDTDMGLDYDPVFMIGSAILCFGRDGNK
jgi:hypothetical protein